MPRDPTSLVQQVRELRRLEAERLRTPLSGSDEARLQQLKTAVDEGLFENDAMANRRQNARVPVDLGVRFTDRPAFRKSYIRNISGGGVFIETDEEIPMGTKVRVQMEFPDRVIACTCTCVWINKTRTSDFARGVGFKFTDLSSDEAHFIHDMVYRAMEKEAAGREPGSKP